MIPSQRPNKRCLVCGSLISERSKQDFCPSGTCKDQDIYDSMTEDERDAAEQMIWWGVKEGDSPWQILADLKESLAGPGHEDDTPSRYGKKTIRRAIAIQRRTVSRLAKKRRK
jgi:predicted nucleic acid-binding Zn ribbon protein